MACYLLHFSEPISPNHTCQHYLGYSSNLSKRLQKHRDGTSKARLLEVAKERGIDFVVAYVWPDGDQELERRLKNQHNHKHHCPICREKEKSSGNG